MADLSPTERGRLLALRIPDNNMRAVSPLDVRLSIQDAGDSVISTLNAMTGDDRLSYLVLKDTPPAIPTPGVPDAGSFLIVTSTGVYGLSAESIGTFHSGTAVPDANIGNNGDVYWQIDLANNNVTFYGPKANGAWPTGVSLRGLDGANGFSIVSRGNFDSNNVSYVSGDLAFNPLTNITYICTNAVTSSSSLVPGVDAAADAFWTPFAVPGVRGLKGDKGDQGDQGRSITLAGPWATGTSYISLAETSHNGGTWRCKIPHVGSAANEPGVGADYTDFWEQGSERGEQGYQGQSIIEVFIAAASLPASAPTATSYDSDGALGSRLMGLTTGWSENVPQTSSGQNVYAARAIYDPALGSTNNLSAFSMPYQAGATGPAGAPGPRTTFMDRGVFSEGSNYAAQIDHVLHNNQRWLCVSPITNAGAADAPGSSSTSWRVLVPAGRQGDKGDKGDKGDGFTLRNVWAEVQIYNVLDNVEVDGSSYNCTRRHISGLGNRPGTGNSWRGFWSLSARGGNNIIVGTLSPQSRDGQDGDLYFQNIGRSTFLFWGQKVNGLWPLNHVLDLSPMKGDKGDKGDPGDDGTIIRSGNNAPLDSFGADGDYYVQLTGGVFLWGPKAAGAWPAMGISLIGSGLPSTGGSAGDIVVRGSVEGSYSLMTPADIIGTLPPGERGAGIQGQGTWTRGENYLGNSSGPRVDLVFVAGAGGGPFLCREDHTASAANHPVTGTSQNRERFWMRMLENITGAGGGTTLPVGRDGNTLLNVNGIWTASFRQLLPDITGADLTASLVPTLQIDGTVRWMVQQGGSGGGTTPGTGATTFVALNDTPGAIAANQFVKGNTTGTDLEFEAGLLLPSTAGVTVGFVPKVQAGGTVTWAQETGGGGGSDTFAGLRDTPGAITANGIVAGNPDGTALTFRMIALLPDTTGQAEDSVPILQGDGTVAWGFLSITDLSDGPATLTGQAGNILTVNQAEDALILSDPDNALGGDFSSLTLANRRTGSTWDIYGRAASSSGRDSFDGFAVKGGDVLRVSSSTDVGDVRIYFYTTATGLDPAGSVLAGTSIYNAASTQFALTANTPLEIVVPANSTDQTLPAGTIDNDYETDIIGQIVFAGLSATTGTTITLEISRENVVRSMRLQAGLQARGVPSGGTVFQELGKTDNADYVDGWLNKDRFAYSRRSGFLPNLAASSQGTFTLFATKDHYGILNRRGLGGGGGTFYTGYTHNLDGTAGTVPTFTLGIRSAGAGATESVHIITGTYNDSLAVAFISGRNGIYPLAIDVTTGTRRNIGNSVLRNAAGSGNLFTSTLLAAGASASVLYYIDSISRVILARDLLTGVVDASFQIPLDSANTLPSGAIMVSRSRLLVYDRGRFQYFAYKIATKELDRSFSLYPGIPSGSGLSANQIFIFADVRPNPIITYDYQELGLFSTLGDTPDEPGTNGQGVAWNNSGQLENTDLVKSFTDLDDTPDDYGATANVPVVVNANRNGLALGTFPAANDSRLPSPVDENFLKGTDSGWENRTIAETRTDLGLPSPVDESFLKGTANGWENRTAAQTRTDIGAQASLPTTGKQDGYVLTATGPNAADHAWEQSASSAPARAVVPITVTISGNTLVLTLPTGRTLSELGSIQFAGYVALGIAVSVEQGYQSFTLPVQLWLLAQKTGGIAGSRPPWQYLIPGEAGGPSNTWLRAASAPSGTASSVSLNVYTGSTGGDNPSLQTLGIVNVVDYYAVGLPL